MSLDLARAAPYLPGVTRILNRTLTPIEADLLQHGTASSRGCSAKLASRLRGDALHQRVRAHLRNQQLPPLLVPSVQAFWPSLRTVLESFSGIEWAEGGIGQHLVGELELRLDGPWPGFRGCPDLVAMRAGKRQLVEIKSSSSAYSRHKPAPGVHAPDQRIAWLKHREATLQIGAYSLLAKTRGMLIEEGVLLVALPGRCQQFTLREGQLANAEQGFLERLAAYGKQLEAEAREVRKGMALAAADGLR